MWEQIKSLNDLKPGMELFRTFNSSTGEIFKVINVSDNTMDLLPYKFVTPKGEFYIHSTFQQVSTIEVNNATLSTFYLQNKNMLSRIKTLFK